MIKFHYYFKNKHIPEHISDRQSSDTGMAMVLICLMGGYYSGQNFYILAAIVLLLVNMTLPTLYRPLARLWIGFSHVLGVVMARLVMMVLFF